MAGLELAWLGLDGAIFYWSSIVAAEKTAAYISRETLQIIEKIEEAGGKVIACVADNAPNMQAALRQVAQEKQRSVNVGCVVHLLNLLIGDLFSNFNVLKIALSSVDELVRTDQLERYSSVRWNSRYDAIKKCVDRDLGTLSDKVIFTQSVNVLEEISVQLMILQADEANVKTVFTSFEKIYTNWADNQSITAYEKNEILDKFTRRWVIFAKTRICAISLFLVDFLDLPANTLAFLSKMYTSEDPGCLSWIQAMLPPQRFDQFETEHTTILDNQVLGIPIVTSSFPVHQTMANVLLKIPISEASVERAFSRHKLVHSQLRASLSAERLNDTLFVRYNFEKILKISRNDKEPVEVQAEIQNWCDVDDQDNDVQEIQ